MALKAELRTCVFKMQGIANTALTITSGFAVGVRGGGLSSFLLGSGFTSLCCCGKLDRPPFCLGSFGLLHGQ